MITDFWKDTGTPDDILQANKIILENMKPYFYGIKEDDIIIEGNIMIGEGTIIKNHSKIVGPVIIGKNCLIDDNVCVGPNTSIGDNSEISQCEIKNSIVMTNCEINCNIKIKNSIIASYSKISEQKIKQDEKIFVLGEGTKITL